MLSAICFNLDNSEILLPGSGLMDLSSSRTANDTVLV